MTQCDYILSLGFFSFFPFFLFFPVLCDSFQFHFFSFFFSFASIYVENIFTCDYCNVTQYSTFFFFLFFILPLCPYMCSGSCMSIWTNFLCYSFTQKWSSFLFRLKIRILYVMCCDWPQGIWNRFFFCGCRWQPLSTIKYIYRNSREAEERKMFRIQKISRNVENFTYGDRVTVPLFLCSHYIVLSLSLF